jgi:hypothetical protein
MAPKVTEIKKIITRNYNPKYGPAELYTGEHDGEMWATNRYWLTRAERIAPLLEQYNLSAAEPGTFDVNGTVRQAGRQVPNFSAFVLSQKDHAPAIPVRIAGNQVYTRIDRGVLYAAFLLADGTHAGLDAGTLEWLSDTDTAPLPEQEDGTRLRYGDIRVSFDKNSHGIPSAVITAEVFHVIERSRWDDEARDYIPAVEEPAEPRVLGMMMGLSYGA